MSFPDLVFEAAFGVNPGDVPTVGQWVDLSDRRPERSPVSWSVGRSSELDRMDAGTGTIRLDNRDRALDPTNEASPYWPHVRPTVRVRLRAIHNTVTYDVFEGFTRGWGQQWEGGAAVEWVDVPIVDGTMLLSLARTSASYVQQQSGARIAALLDAADWPAGKRDLDAGQSEVQAVIEDRRSVLASIRDTAEAESGVFYIDPNGDATFRDRYSRVTAESQATFGGASALKIRDLNPTFDDSQLWNDVAVKPEGLTIQRAEDATSIDQYGRRSLPEFGGLITTELEAQDAADWTLRRYKDARRRVERIVIQGHRSDDTLTQVLSRRLGDRITVHPPTGDPTDVFIEHLSHQVGQLQWTTTWRLSPAFSETVWLIGVQGFSEIGDTTYVGY